MSSSSVGTVYIIPGTLAWILMHSIAALGAFKFDTPQDYEHHTTNLTPEYLNKFASGKIPAFEDKDGFCLFEKVAVARYLASLSTTPALLGSSLKETALIDQWVSFADSEIRAHFYGVWLLLNDKLPYNKVTDNKHREDVKQGLSVVEKHFEKHTFLVGERISLADLNLAIVYKLGYALILDEAFRSGHPNTLRWFQTIINHPKLKEFYVGLEFVDKPKQFAGRAKAT